MIVSNRFAILTLIVLGILLYLTSISGGFVWDDEDFVYANTYVRDFRIDKFFSENVNAGRGKSSNYFRPVQLLVYSAVHKAFGFNPSIFHSVNVVIHIAAAITVFFFIKNLTDKPLVGLLTSFMFLLHPVQTESVSYISGLSDPLFVLFGFLSLIFYLQWMRGSEKRMNLVNYVISTIFFLSSLLSKEIGIVFLPFIALVTVIFNRWKKIYLLLPYLIITILYLIYHYSVISVLDMKLVWGSTLYSASITVRLATFINNLREYLILLVFPKDLFMERDFTIQIQTSLISLWVIFFILLNLIIFIILIKKLKSNDRFKYLLFFFIAFYISFAPISGLVLINGIFYEHFLYLPLIFFFGFLFLLVEKLLNKKVLIAIGLIMIVFSVRSVLRQLEWADAVSLYNQTLKHAPASVRVRNNLAITLSERREYDRAINEYRKALELDPNIPNMYHNLANLYRDRGDLVAAEHYYRQAIKVSPGFLFSYESLLSLYQEQEDNEKFDELLLLYKQRFAPVQISN